MNSTIAVLAGDGIGPEVVSEARKVLDLVFNHLGYSIEFKEGLIGAAAIDATDSPYPEETHTLCESSKAILFGAIGHPKYDNNPSVKVRPEQGLLAMRKRLGLYANVRPVTVYPELADASPIKREIVKNVDLVIYRELTGGLYFGEPRGRSENGETAFDSCVYTKEEIERIAHKAYQAAQKRRKKMTLVDKANVLATSRLWREVVQDIAPSYPDVETSFLFVDNAAMQLIRNPGEFDVMLTENLFGDILSDEASVLPGSMGMLPSASLGDSVGLYEPIHGSFPEATGKGIANPLATILSAAMMLEISFELPDAAHLIQKAVKLTLANRQTTPDILNGKLTTAEVGEAVCTHIKQLI